MGRRRTDAGAFTYLLGKAPMRSLISSVVLSLVAVSALAQAAPPAKDPAEGRWICKEKLGDGSTYGFELKAGGAAKAIHTETMRVEHWRRVDATHIELTEVSEGNHGKSTEKVNYEVSFGKDGSMVLKDGGNPEAMYAGTYVPQPAAKQE